jgi:hypothetical protein
MFLELAYQSYEFEGVDGDIHAFSGCSLAGKFEFDKRLAELQDYLTRVDSGDTTAVLYRHDRRFRWLVDRCLKLNGIDAHWVNWPMVEQFLFCREVEGEWKTGWLIEINETKGSGKGEPVTLAELVALTANATSGLTEALTLAESVPLQALMDILAAQAEQVKTPEEKEAASFDDWKERKREMMAKRGAEGWSE